MMPNLCNQKIDETNIISIYDAVSVLAQSSRSLLITGVFADTGRTDKKLQK
jgi:hypothetical protein